jgi:hypothetical protein
MFRAVEIYFLFSIGFNYREKFFIMYLVVKFGCSKLSREVSNRILFSVLVSLE